MQWISPVFSKKKVNKSAQLLVDNEIALEEKLEAYRVISNFRSSHGYPIQSMLGLFRQKAFDVDKKAIIVRRLKRIPSIINKLKRHPKMALARMNDVGGVKIITNSMTNVHKIKELSLIDKLKAYNHLLKVKTPKTNTELFLLQLDTKEKTISIFSYEENYYDEAYENYRRIESEIAEDNTKDVVMVFANSMEELKKAYPNYLADTEVFLENLNKVIK